ncbi:tyrosine aminotransferase [Hyalella azteca]|uniref:Tyrosine aminotransferase n=1 Tax=Hyalella azteca TaxID=294128 RepID=A0A8B7NVD7_HYAAZ|nr:tyrosine aminotransferase [Hyalella azteca]
MKGRATWDVRATNFAKKTFNPIRDIVENMNITPHPDKPMIALSIGDPTVFGNLRPAESVVDAVVDSVRSGKNNGYVPATGTLQARQAIAEYMTCPGAPVEAKDVIICSGCSCSLDLCVSVLCSPGSSILVPRPGFPLYTTLAEGFGCTSKYYNLLPEKNWQVDLVHLESLVDDTTVAIVINNPSNPCGSVFPKSHLRAIADIAVKYKIPIIADEIYDNFVFEGEEYHPIASVHPELPVLACGGLTKRFLVPGWRMGWIAVHDRNGAMQEVLGCLRTLSQRIIGSNTIVQGALPDILSKTPQSFFDDTLKQIQVNARYCYESVQKMPGLTPILPQGAMYMMVRINMDEFPEFATDLEFVEAMVAEESVFCLPGKCFNIKNFFRIVLTVPEETMKVACQRMTSFCIAHHTGQKQTKIHEDSISNSIQTEEPTINEIDESPKTNGNSANGYHINGKTNGMHEPTHRRINELDVEPSVKNPTGMNEKLRSCEDANVDDLVDDMECD